VIDDHSGCDEPKPGVAKEFVASGKHRKPLGFSDGFCFEEPQPELRKAGRRFYERDLITRSPSKAGEP
jgi:hypothetical protein